MIFGLSHVDVPVSQMERALAFYSGALGFQVCQKGAGFADLDAHSARIRLIVTARPEHHAALRIQVGDVAAAQRALEDAGGRRAYEPTRTVQQELVASVLDHDQNTITIWRPLTEDEYETVPELPTRGAWDPAAHALLKNLLGTVPAMFRMLARRKVVRVVEELATGAGHVNTEHVVRGFILSSARVTRYRTREPLRRHGFNPDDYAQDYAE